MMRGRSGVAVGLRVGLVVVGLVLAGCGGADESSDAPASDAAAAPSVQAAAPSAADEEPEASQEPSAGAVDADVTVVLGEWIVEPTPTSATAGEVAITADNQGGEAHELVVVRADDAAALPTDADGAVDEEQIAEEDFIGEIEEFPNGEQRSADFDLEAGTYVLFCNITETEDDGEVESHFEEGMHAPLTVE